MHGDTFLTYSESCKFVIASERKEEDVVFVFYAFLQHEEEAQRENVFNGTGIIHTDMLLILTEYSSPSP